MAMQLWPRMCTGFALLQIILLPLLFWCDHCLPARLCGRTQPLARLNGDSMGQLPPVDVGLHILCSTATKESHALTGAVFATAVGGGILVERILFEAWSNPLHRATFSSSRRLIQAEAATRYVYCTPWLKLLRITILFQVYWCCICYKGAVGFLLKEHCLICLEGNLKVTNPGSRRQVDDVHSCLQNSLDLYWRVESQLVQKFNHRRYVTVISRDILGPSPSQLGCAGGEVGGWGVRG